MQAVGGGEERKLFKRRVRKKRGEWCFAVIENERGEGERRLAARREAEIRNKNDTTKTTEEKMMEHNYFHVKMKVKKGREKHQEE